MYTISFYLGDNYVKLISDNESTIKWAKEALLPLVKIGESKYCVVTIECFYGTIENPIGELIGNEDLFLGKKGKKYQHSNGMDVIDEQQVLYRVINGKILIYYPALSEETMKEAARFCREILYNSLQPGDQWMEIHAAAIAYKNNAIAFVGDKGVGKSTFLSVMLSNLIDDSNIQFQYITNDRLWVKNDSPSYLALGSPMPILLGYGTMMMIPELREKLTLYQDGYYMLNNLYKEKRREFTVKEFTQIFSTGTASCTKLKAIIFLNSKEEFLPRQVMPDQIESMYKVLARDTAHSTYPNWINEGKSADERELFIPEKLSMYEIGVQHNIESFIRAKQRVLEILEA